MGIEYIASARVPRLRLRHEQTSVEVDVVEASRDSDALAKDAYVQAWLDKSPEIVAFAKAVRGWCREHILELPRSERYPNAFLFLLVGLWFLQALVGINAPECTECLSAHGKDNAPPSNRQ